MPRKKKTPEQKLADAISNFVEDAVEDAIEEVKVAPSIIVTEPQPAIIVPETPAIIVKTKTSKEWVLTEKGWDLV